MFRLIYAIVCYFDLEIKQIDAVNTYLNAKLYYRMYYKPLLGIEANGRILLLLRALYGLKESGYL